MTASPSVPGNTFPQQTGAGEEAGHCLAQHFSPLEGTRRAAAPVSRPESRATPRGRGPELPPHLLGLCSRRHTLCSVHLPGNRKAKTQTTWTRAQATVRPRRPLLSDPVSHRSQSHRRQVPTPRVPPPHPLLSPRARPDKHLLTFSAVAGSPPPGSHPGLPWDKGRCAVRVSGLTVTLSPLSVRLPPTHGVTGAVHVPLRLRAVCSCWDYSGLESAAEPRALHGEQWPD